MVMDTEQNLHVFHRINGYPGFAYVAHYPRVVRIVAPVGRQVKGYGQTFLPGGQVAAVKRVGFFGGGKTGVLTDGPGLHQVHGRVGSAQVRRNAGSEMDMRQVFYVIGRVAGVQGYSFRSLSGRTGGCRGW
jgi:hypothetical protein